MAYWKAAAIVHDVPETELRPKLVEAHDALDEIASELGCEAYEEDILEAIGSLKNDVESAESERDEKNEENEKLTEKLEDAESKADRFETLAFAPLEERKAEFDKKEREFAARISELEATERRLKAEVELLEQARAKAVADGDTARLQLEAARAGAAVTIAALKKPAKLSANLKKALALAASNNGLGSWDVGAGTLGALKKRGLVERCADGRYCLTEAGKEALR